MIPIDITIIQFNEVAENHNLRVGIIIKNHIMKNLLLLVGLVLTTGVFAQFAIPVNQPQMNTECYAVKVDGTKVEGTWTGASLLSGYLNSTTIKMANGEKVKFKAAELNEFAFKVKKGSFFEPLTGGAGSMRFSAEDMEKLMDREWIHYVQGKKKGKKKSKKVRLVQCLNYGWETPLEVYVDPNAKTGMGISVGGISVAGARLKSYIICKDGVPMMIEKGKYKKQSKEIYGDCPELATDFPELDWKDFPKHVFTYNQLMKSK